MCGRLERFVELCHYRTENRLQRFDESFAQHNVGGLPQWAVLLQQEATPVSRSR